ncbi:HTH_Tnp_Tc3_2 domain-containing protein [Trichonephila clavipes]|nr:HTH_Tnp_Tc3_2 domain-containing protein [Trichonephila clavipes]
MQALKMSKQQYLDDGMKWSIVGMLETGLSQIQNCREFNLTPRVELNLQKQFQGTGIVGCYSPRLSHKLYANIGNQIPRVTIFSRLHKRGWFVRRPVVCICLSSAHRRVHFKWCRDHRDWSMEQLATVLFIDESRFCLTSDSRRIFIWRESENCCLSSNAQENDHYGSRGLTVWAGIMLGSRMLLCL